MAAVSVSDVPHGTADTFGGLLRDGETPEDALRRLEKTRAYTKVIGSDDGQRLLAAATTQTKNGIPSAKPRRTKVEHEVDVLVGRGMDLEAHELAAVAAPDSLRCVGSNHVPGHSVDCPKYQAKPVAVAAAAQLLELPLDLVDVGANVRVDPGELADLVASIREHGVLQPVKAMPHPAYQPREGRYLLIWGQRRVLASRLVGLSTIPAIVVDHAHDWTPATGPDPKRSIEQLAENLVRKDLNPIEEATALRAVLDATPGLTQEVLADKLGRSRPWLSNALRLLTLAEPALDAVRSGRLSASHGRALAGLTPAIQTSIVESGVKQSSHQLEQTIAWRTAEADEARKKVDRTAKAIPKAIAALEAAGVAKGTTVYLQGAYNLDSPALHKAITAAGWKVANTYLAERPEKGKCDCTAVRIEFYRVWTVKPACANDKHRDRARSANDLDEKKRRKALEAREAVLHQLVRPLLDELPVVLLILAHGDHWGTPALVKSALADDSAKVVELRDLVANALVDRVRPSRIWNDREGAVTEALEGLIALLGGPPAVIELPAAEEKP